MEMKWNFCDEDEVPLCLCPSENRSRSRGLHIPGMSWGVALGDTRSLHLVLLDTLVHHRPHLITSTTPHRFQWTLVWKYDSGLSTWATCKSSVVQVSFGRAVKVTCPSTSLSSVPPRLALKVQILYYAKQRVKVNGRPGRGLRLLSKGLQTACGSGSVP